MSEGDFIGPIKCPHCESFVSHEASVCPYCCMSLMNAPWKTKWTTGTVVATIVIILTLIAKHFDPTIFDGLSKMFAGQ